MRTIRRPIEADLSKSTVDALVQTEYLPHGDPASNGSRSVFQDFNTTRDDRKYKVLHSNQITPSTLPSRNPKSSRELDLDSTRKLVASLMMGQDTPKLIPFTQHNSELTFDTDHVPCKDVETLFESSTFVDHSDVDAIDDAASCKILRFTGPTSPESGPPQPRSTERRKPLERRLLPVVNRGALKLPLVPANHPGMIDLCVIAIGASTNGRQLVHRFVPAANQWDVVSALPDARHHHSMVALQHVLYVAGGKDVKQSKLATDFWSFDTLTRSWFVERCLPEPRSHFGLIAVHQCIYALGGQSATSGQALATVRCYDPVIKIWHEVLPMAAARIGAAYTRHRNLIVAAGGIGCDGVVLASVECYDLLAERWHGLDDLRAPRVGAKLCSIGDAIYISGGTNGYAEPNRCVDRLDMMAQSAASWQLVDCMEESRKYHGATVIGAQMLFIGGGARDQPESSIEAFCTERRMWIGSFGQLPAALGGCVTSLVLQNEDIV